MKKRKKIPKKKIQPVSVLPKRIVKVTFLVLPAVLSFAGLSFLKISNRTLVLSQRGILLGPPKDSQQLAFGLFVFTIGYLLFLFVLFFSNIKQAFEELISRMH